MNIDKSDGQALAELAIFSTVLLFVFTLLLRYGMNANQQQNMQMESFRKGFVRAASSDSSRGGRFDPGWEYETGRPPLPSNHWRNVSYVVIEDKPIFSASGVLPIAERNPVGDSVEAFCTMDAFAQMEYGNRDDLPRIEYEVNRKRYSFTIADYRQYNVNNITMRKKEDIPNWDGEGVSWQWKDVSAQEVNIGDAVDVDGDDKEEYVLEKAGTIFKTLDYQEGEIDLTAETGKLGKKVQGLLPEYTQRLVSEGSTLQRQEDSSRIVSTENLRLRFNPKRTIRTNNGDYSVEDNITRDRTTTWSTPHK